MRRTFKPLVRLGAILLATQTFASEGTGERHCAVAASISKLCEVEIEDPSSFEILQNCKLTQKWIPMFVKIPKDSTWGLTRLSNRDDWEPARQAMICSIIEDGIKKNQLIDPDSFQRNLAPIENTEHFAGYLPKETKKPILQSLPDQFPKRKMMERQGTIEEPSNLDRSDTFPDDTPAPMLSQKNRAMTYECIKLPKEGNPFGRAAIFFDLDPDQIDEDSPTDEDSQEATSKPKKNRTKRFFREAWHQIKSGAKNFADGVAAGKSDGRQRNRRNWQGADNEWGFSHRFGYFLGAPAGGIGGAAVDGCKETKDACASGWHEICEAASGAGDFFEHVGEGLGDALESFGDGLGSFADTMGDMDFGGGGFDCGGE